MATIVITGIFTRGYYNEMEAGFPVFIDEQPVDDLIKDKLKECGLPSNFCDQDFGDQLAADNYLIGKRIRLTIEIDD